MDFVVTPYPLPLPHAPYTRGARGLYPLPESFIEAAEPGHGPPTVAWRKPADKGKKKLAVSLARVQQSGEAARYVTSQGL